MQIVNWFNQSIKKSGQKIFGLKSGTDIGSQSKNVLKIFRIAKITIVDSKCLVEFKLHTSPLT